MGSVRIASNTSHKESDISNNNKVPTVLLLLKGNPGTGKSTIGRHLARGLGWPIIDKDDSRDALERVASSVGTVQADWNSLSYEIMWAHVDTQLSCGLSCIVDCPLARQFLWNRAKTIADRHNVAVMVVECIASRTEVWSKRLEERGKVDAGSERSHKPASIEEVNLIIRRNEGSEKWLDSMMDVCRVCVDLTVDDLEESYQLVVNRLIEFVQQDKATI